MKTTRGHSKARRQRGVAAVELGILLGPLVLLVAGVAEYGRAIYSYNMIVKSTRDAVRYLTQFPANDLASVAAAKKLVVYGNTAGTGPALVTGLTTSNVDWCDAFKCPGTHALQLTGGGATVNLVTVRVTGFAFSSIVPGLVASFTFGDVAVTMGQVL